MPHLNQRKQNTTTLVTIETTKVFASFRYDISVKERIEQKKIHYRIMGLRAPRLSLPAAGPAQFSKEYDGLKGNYIFVVEGLDGTVSTFSVRLSPRPMKLLKSSPITFVETIVNDSSSVQNRSHTGL
jgi:hypothetical protein